MTSEAKSPSGGQAPSAAACAQAAAWIARLHGEDRNRKMESGLKRWLAANPGHRAAFEMANDIWIAAERRPKPAADTFVGALRSDRLLNLARAPLVSATLAAIVAVGAILYFRDPGLATRVGEQRTFMLEDGTRVTLNTATRIHVHYDRAARRIKLDRGEALFEVAKRPSWPFIVTAGPRQVRALGTEFLVRRDDQQVVVTLIEGKVAVSPTISSSAFATARTAPSLEQQQRGARPSSAAGEQSGASLTRGETSSQAKGASMEAQDNTYILASGEGLTFFKNDSPTLNRPVLEKVTAWERGHVLFDHTLLADAVEEMNRYSETELRIESPAAARAQVTGIFRTGDSENFAQAVAEAYQLKVISESRRIVLAGIPRERSP